MTIRISDPLQCIMLHPPAGSDALFGPDQLEIERAGARVQSLLVETVAHTKKLLCPSCLEEQDTAGGSVPIYVGICWACGESVIGVRRPFKNDGPRWYSFNPF